MGFDIKRHHDITGRNGGGPAEKEVRVSRGMVQVNIPIVLDRQPGRPRVCASLQPSQEMCGASQEQAMFYLSELERMTA